MKLAWQLVYPYLAQSSSRSLPQYAAPTDYCRLTSLVGFLGTAIFAGWFQPVSSVVRDNAHCVGNHTHAKESRSAHRFWAGR